MTPSRVAVYGLRVGRCRHPERVTLCGGAWGAVDFPAHCALIIHPSIGPILYDTGYADHFEEETRALPGAVYRALTPVQLPAEERLTRQLARHGVQPGDVERVFISHFHADHVAGLRDLPRARFVALRDDVPANLRHSGWSGLRRGFLPGLLPADFGGPPRLGRRVSRRGSRCAVGAVRPGLRPSRRWQCRRCAATRPQPVATGPGGVAR